LDSIIDRTEVTHDALNFLGAEVGDRLTITFIGEYEPRASPHRRNELGIPTAQGKTSWPHQSVKDILLNPRLAGLLVHRGSVAGEAVWPPVCSVEEHARLRALLAARSKPAASRTSPLTPVFWCARCESKLQGGRQRGRKLKPGEEPHRRYICSNQKCASGILAEPVALHVAKLITFHTIAHHYPGDDGIDRVLRAGAPPGGDRRGARA
jgi:hypothetical protein